MTDSGRIYRLSRAALYRRIGGTDCFCALGVFLSEKGHTPEEIAKTQYILFDEPGYMDDVRKLVEALGLPPAGPFDDGFEPVYRANDMCGDREDGRMTVPAVPASKFEEAFKAIGMNVQLIDVRQGYGG